MFARRCSGLAAKDGVSAGAVPAKGAALALQGDLIDVAATEYVPLQDAALGAIVAVRQAIAVR